MKYYECLSHGYRDFIITSSHSFLILGHDGFCKPKLFANDFGFLF